MSTKNSELSSLKNRKNHLMIKKVSANEYE